MTRKRVLIVGATGQTGNSVLNGLLEYGKFNVEIQTRPSSADSPKVKSISDRGVRVVIADITEPIQQLAQLLHGFDTVISCIDAVHQMSQINLATAAKQAGVKRFVPCGFMPVVPPGDVMALRDEKETINNHVRKLFLPYTYIDVGFWHQVSFPTLPSGRVDYASVYKPNTVIHAGGDAPNLLTDLRDVGRFVARIIDDERTLNKAVFTWSDVLSENQIFDLVEKMSGEKITRTYISSEEIEGQVERIKAAIKEDESNVYKKLALVPAQYSYTKAVRGDNNPEYAKYLGYLDARELYPDFKPIPFREFLEEVLSGKAEPAYRDHEGFKALQRGLQELSVVT